MKITRITISGFRGIPPKEPPDLQIDLTDKNGNPRDILIFGPNAFGKSSIADALEWFFKEHARGSNYFDSYEDRDNVHLHVGQSGHPDRASIELELQHNGDLHTVRKELDSSGCKSLENLGGIPNELARCREEIIVLDHDQFRGFVTAANKDRWSTFSSLIGYEELDHFRAGLASLSGNSLNTELGKAKLERDLESRRGGWKKRVRETSTQSQVDLSSEPLVALETHLVNQLAVMLASLDLPTYSVASDLSERFWRDLRARVQPSDAYQQASERLRELGKLRDTLSPFPATFDAQAKRLLERVRRLSTQKGHFDKRLLAAFYQSGLQVIRENKSRPDHCPFCETPYKWETLIEEVTLRHQELDIESITREASELSRAWKRLAQDVESCILAARICGIPRVSQAAQELMPFQAVATALELESFDASVAEKWTEDHQELARIVSEQRSEVSRELEAVKTSMGDNPAAQLESDIDRLEALWRIWLEMTEEWMELQALENRVQVMNQVVDALRSVGGAFRQELSDFSGRVVELINQDVNRYYDALHPNDGVKPFLQTEIVGQQRKVALRCDFRGIRDCDAASLLSESHRNSLGLAIMLAFLKYKRQTGSPVEFLVLDDVTQSFDVGHRLNLVNFLRDLTFPEIADSQVVFLTHDRTLADLILRPGESNENWKRYDIRSWQLHNILVEPNEIDLLQRARTHLANGDEMAAAVYGRHALEQVYKEIVARARILMPYNPRPWKTSLDEFQQQISGEVNRLWNETMLRKSTSVPKGFIDPVAVDMNKLNAALRVLHTTVHDSDFLDNPPSLQEVQSAVDAVAGLRDLFTCPHCRLKPVPEYHFFRTLERTKQGNIPQCTNCNKPLA